MKEKRSRTFRLKLVILITAIISILSVLIFLYSVNNFEHHIKADFQKQVDLVKQQFLTAANDLFVSGKNTHSFDTVLVHTARHVEINYAVVTDGRGKIQTSFNPDLIDYGGFFKNGEIKETTSEEENIVRLVLPVYDGRTLKGVVFAGISKLHLNQSIKNARFDFAIACGAIIVVGFLLSLFAGWFVTRPFSKILKGADKILNGDYAERIKVKSAREFVAVAGTLNVFAERMEELNAQVLRLNDQLKNAFRSKLGELNLEINQRRIAEESLRKSEEQFRLLFNIAPIGMAITSPDRVIAKVNFAFEQTLGYSEDELTDLTTHELTYYEDRGMEEKIYKKILTGELSSNNYEKRYVTKNGKIIDVVNRVILYRNEKGKPVQFIEQVIDITEQKKLQTDLVYAKEKAEESDRMKSAFLAQMSHEIRTPLNVILAASSIFEEELSEHLDEDAKEIVESVKSAGKRLMRTIDLILNMSAIQTGKYEPEFEKIDLNLEVKRLTEEFRTICNEKKLNLSFSSHTDSATVKGDKYTVQQIFQNLISNAVKYTRKGSVEVVIFKTDKVFVEIKDTGIGMSRDYQKELFHPFSQEDVGQRREFEGNGLGLALVKKYIEINNANIKVESEKDRGTTFTVIF